MLISVHACSCSDNGANSSYLWMGRSAEVDMFFVAKFFRVIPIYYIPIIVGASNEPTSEHVNYSFLFLK